MIAVAHPYLLLCVHAGKQGVCVLEVDGGVAIFALRGFDDSSTERIALQLHPIADPQHWYRAIKHPIRHGRCAVVVDARRTAR